MQWYGAADEADVIVDADDIALRPSAMREHCRITSLGIAPLRAGTVDIDIVILANLPALRLHTR